MLGHANISITLDLYSHVLPALKREAASKLNHLFDNSTPKIEEDEPEQINSKKTSRILTKTKSRELNLEI